MTTPSTPSRRRGKGTLGLLTGANPVDPEGTPAPTGPDATPGPAGPSNRLWAALDSNENELARVSAPDIAAAAEAVTDKTGLRGGFSLAELDPATAMGRVVAQTGRAGGLPSGPPPMLSRTRAMRVARDKLTVSIPVSVLDGLSELAQRDGTRRYDEVEEALRNHLERRGIRIQED